MAPSSRDEATTVSLARLTGMGTEFLSAILAGGGIGWLIDYWLGSQPTGLVIGLITGITVGGVTFIRHALAANKAASDAYARSQSRASRDEETDA